MSTKLTYEELSDKIKEMTPADAVPKNLPTWLAQWGWTIDEVAAAAAAKKG